MNLREQIDELHQQIDALNQRILAQMTGRQGEMAPGVPATPGQ